MNGIVAVMLSFSYVLCLNLDNERLRLGIDATLLSLSSHHINDIILLQKFKMGDEMQALQAT